MFEALFQAWGQILDPVNLVALATGVLIGLMLGAIPGLGGLIGLTILIPFIYELSPTSSIIMLMGLAAVTATSDSIPAILFGIPGTVAAQATVLDGYPMAQKGQAARAMGAAFSASAIGGVIGALVLFASIPIIRPLVLQFRSPEFFMLALLGISMVAILSRGAVVKGLAAGGFGLLLTTIGQDDLTGVFRYVYDTAYLWEGLPIVAVALGLFAIPELIDLVIGGTSVAQMEVKGVGAGKWQGVKDTLRNWVGVLRSSVVGVYVGVIPGFGGSVVDWFAYGIAKQTSRNSETFGTGDVRGVIAVDAASNAKEGGALVTTLGFGIPGSVTMALMLAAFDIHGLAPGPPMLTTNLVFTLTLVWGLVIANLMAAAMCFVFTRQIAQVALIRAYRVFPVLIALIYLGGFQGRQVFTELITLSAFGLLGWSMKRAGWPRPPLLLGFILGANLQNALFLSIDRYGASWILEPIPLILAALCIASVLLAFVYKPGGDVAGPVAWTRRPHFPLQSVVAAIFVIAGVFFVVEARDWPYSAALFPVAIGIPTFGLAVMALARDTFTTPGSAQTRGFVETMAPAGVGTPVGPRAIEAFAWIGSLVVGVWVAGFPAAIAVFMLLYLRFRSRESWLVAVSVTVVFVGVLYFFFDRVLHVVWPEGLIGLG